MKKKILIVSHAMNLGGAERALLGLLDALDKEKYRIDLFLLRHIGPLMDQIPVGVHLLPENPQYAALLMPMKLAVRKKQYGVVFGRLKGKVAAKRFCKKNLLPKENSVGLEYSHKYSLPFLPQISEEKYDLAVSFLTPHYIVLRKTDAIYKVAWIHTDYSQISIDSDSELEMWSGYDKIASISESASKAFAGVFPSLSERIILLPNILIPEWIRQKADEFSVENEMPDDGSIKLLSVGRFCRAKNFDNIPDICKRLRNLGHNVKWYLIGFGSDEELINRKIVSAGMEEHIRVLGKKENPYPYMKACDLYVQPSRYEGNAVTVHEAQILGKSVIITDFPTAAGQLNDGYDGIIVPKDNEGCAKYIHWIIEDEELRRKIQENTKNVDYTNKEYIRAIYDLLGQD